MKKILTIGIAAVAAFMAVNADAAMTLAEANARLSEAASNPDAMASITKELSAADQVAFLGAVNGAIDKMPVSAEEKTAMVLAANKAALTNAAKGNLPNMLAEVFATAPMESLPAVNERFAAELFNVSSSSSGVDDKMVSNIVATVAIIQQRTASADVSNAAQRNTFAALMFINATNPASGEAGAAPAAGQQGATAGQAGATAGAVAGAAALREALVATLPAEAATEWIPAALGEGEPKSYEPILGIGSTTPDSAVVDSLMPMVPAALADALMADVTAAGTSNPSAFSGAYMNGASVNLPPSVGSIESSPVIKTQDPSLPWYNGAKRGETYPGQTTAP